MARKKKEDISNIIFPILAILIVATAIVSNYEKDCGYNEECFYNSFYECSKAKVIAYENDNTFEYRILEQKGEFCLVEVEILEVNPKVSLYKRETFQNKMMTCQLPIEQGFTTDELNYCEGPLKEAIYELTIQKMYSLLAQNLGDIISEMK